MAGKPRPLPVTWHQEGLRFAITDNKTGQVLSQGNLADVALAILVGPVGAHGRKTRVWAPSGRTNWDQFAGP